MMMRQDVERPGGVFGANAQRRSVEVLVERRVYFYPHHRPTVTSSLALVVIVKRRLLLLILLANRRRLRLIQSLLLVNGTLVTHTMISSMLLSVSSRVKNLPSTPVCLVMTFIFCEKFSISFLALL